MSRRKPEFQAIDVATCLPWLTPNSITKHGARLKRACRRWYATRAANRSNTSNSLLVSSM